MKLSRYTLVLLMTVLIMSVPFVSFADDINITWQDDLDESARGMLTVQQYDVYTLPYGTQGPSYSNQNWTNNVLNWQNESIIFDPERLFGEPSYVDAAIATKSSGRNLDIIFYNNRANYGDASKQSLKAWGYFVPKASGYYRFKTLSDDGSALSIFKNENNLQHLTSEEDLLVNAMSVSFYNDGQSDVIYLNAKEPYLIQLKYFNWGGDGLFTFNVAYSQHQSHLISNPNYQPVHKNELYPSKKDDLYLIHGDKSALVNKITAAKIVLNDNLNEDLVAIESLRNAITHAETVVTEYYNYTQEEMDKALNDLDVAAEYLENLETTEVAVKALYDDLLIDSKGKLMVQKYIASDLTSAHENDNTNNSYNNNKARWLNPNIIFNEDRKDGQPKLYPADITKERINAAVEEIFFYNGGGSFGYDAKEIKEGWGYFVPNRTGFYNFKTLFDDGVKAYLFTDETDIKHYDNEKDTLADYYAIGDFTRTSSTYELEAGKPYPIYINHFNWHGPNRLALQYRYGSTSSNVSSDYKDIPSSWFYGSNKDDFFLIHGEKSKIADVMSDINAVLDGTSSTSATEAVKTKLRELLTKAEEMYNEYYNYTDSEITNLENDYDNIINGVVYSSKIKRYTKDGREYIEIDEDFSDGAIDPAIMTREFYNPIYSNSYVSGKAFYLKGETRYQLTQSLKDYDYIEIKLDQIDTDDQPNRPYAGIGVSETVSSGQQVRMQLIDRDYISKNKNNVNMTFTHSSSFEVKKETSYTSKLVAVKSSNGKYDLTLDLYPKGKSNKPNKLLGSVNNLSDNDSEKYYDFEKIFIGNWNSGSSNYVTKVDNLKIIAYKELIPVEAEISNFTAQTSDNGKGINLTWDVDQVDFDSYVVKEIIDGQIVHRNDMIPSTENSYYIEFDNQNKFKDRTFEIYAKRGSMQTEAQSTDWQGGVRFVEITRFIAETQGSKIKLSWDKVDTSIIDKYVLKEFVDGSWIVIDDSISKNKGTISINQSSTLGSRKFSIEAKRGEQSSSSVEADWVDELNSIEINNFDAEEKVSSLPNKIELTWDSIVGDFDKLKITQTLNGVETIIEIAKTSTSLEFELSETPGNRTYTIVAVKGSRESRSETAIWKDAKALSITNFVVNQELVNGRINLTWDRLDVPTDNFDHFEIIETINGVSSTTNVQRLATSYNFDLTDQSGDRVYSISAVKGSRKSDARTGTWIDVVAIDINNFDVDSLASGNSTKAILSWSPVSGNFDHFEITQTVNGVTTSVEVPKDSTSYEFDLTNLAADRTYTIAAVRGVRKTTPKSVVWKDPKLITITNFASNDLTNSNLDKIRLTWNAETADYDGFKITQTLNGNVITRKIASNLRVYEFDLTSEVGDRRYTIAAYSANRESDEEISTWTDVKNISINNFNAAEDTSSNPDKIKLTWDTVTGDYDEFKIIQTLNGVLTSYVVPKGSTSYSIDLTSEIGDRSYSVVAIKGGRETAPSTAIWDDNLADISINSFNAKADGDSIVLSWDSVGGSFDSLVVTKLGSPSVIKTLSKTDTTTQFPLNSDTSTKNFTIHASRNSRNSASATTSWSISQNSMTINQISGHTGKKLATLVFEGNVGQTIIGNVEFEDYKLEGFATDNITFTIASNPATINAMYTKVEGSSVDESNWQSEALESINSYAISGKIDFFEDSFYETKYDDGEPSDSENTKNDLHVDFKRILETAGLTDVREKNLDKYKDAILAGDPYPNLTSLQELIEEINGPIDTTNKDKKDDDYVDLVDNTKVTSHDFEFGLATEINISNDPIYSPSFEFALQGNEYLTYKNPTVYLYDSNRNRVSSKATIEYDAANFKYDIVIVPTGPEALMMTQGVYYVNLDTKTEVNTEVHTLEHIKENNTDTASKAMFSKNWQFSYFINDIVVAGNKITDGLSSTMKIKYKTSESSSTFETITSERIKFELENTKTLPGGF